jgi:membrane-associated phospholipid phosphatase
LTVGVGAARVTGGAHHVPDVVVGGLLGAAFGVLVPLVVLAPSDSIPVADGIRVSELSLGFSGGQASLNGLWF